MQVESFYWSSFDAGTLLGSDRFLFFFNLRSVLNKYPLGPQPCAYNYSDGRKDYKTFFVFIAYDDGNDFTQTHLCIQSV